MRTFPRPLLGHSRSSLRKVSVVKYSLALFDHHPFSSGSRSNKDTVYLYQCAVSSFRKMYWSDWGSFPKIEQANMDTSSRTTLVSSGLVWVNSLALDYENRLLYWCDAYLDKIERVDLHGNNRVLILDLSLGDMHPFGLALSDDALFWSDWNKKSIHKYNMTTFMNEVVVHGMGKPMELHIYDQSEVFSGKESFLGPIDFQFRC